MQNLYNSESAKFLSLVVPVQKNICWNYRKDFANRKERVSAVKLKVIF